jgi:hypothetical protein
MFPNYGNYYSTKQCLPNCPTYMYQDKGTGNVIINPENSVIINGNLDVQCHDIKDVSGIYFCDNTYIGHGNSFDISTNQILKIKQKAIVVNEYNYVGINTLTPAFHLDVSGNANIRGTLNLNDNYITNINVANTSELNLPNVIYDLSTNTLKYKLVAYGTFISDASQSFPTNTASELKYSTSQSSSKNLELAYDASTSAYTHVKVLIPGVYKVGTSLQLTQTASPAATINIWFRKNGINIPSSSSIINMDGNNSFKIVYVEIIESFAENDKIEIMAGTAGNGMVAVHSPAQTFNGITSPAAPAIITTVILIS